MRGSKTNSIGGNDFSQRQLQPTNQGQVDPEDDQLAELLNGLGFNQNLSHGVGVGVDSLDSDRYFDDQIFFIDGEPTDHFLEALKRDEQFQDSLHLLNKPVHIDRREGHRNTHDKLGSNQEQQAAGPLPRRHREDSRPYETEQASAKYEGSGNKNDPHTFSNLKSSESCKVMATSEKPNYSKPLTRETKTLHSSVGELSKEEISSETKVKSLELRINGQLKTIRNLETQVSELEQTLKDRNQQIFTLNAKVRNLSGSAHGNYEVRGTNKFATVAAKSDKQQSHIELLELRLGDEQSRRQRAEERCKTLRDYLEATKTRTLELERKDLDLQKTIHDLQQRLIKYRKDCRELGLTSFDFRVSTETAC
jgi:uncharacterized coiled-coil protein SlyX